MGLAINTAGSLYAALSANQRNARWAGLALLLAGDLLSGVYMQFLTAALRRAQIA